MIRQVLHYPNAMLSKAADDVHVFDEKIVQLAEDLRETANAFKAEGLAATQVGSLYRIFVIREDGSDNYLICINPLIIKKSTEQVDSTEGCLSFPGVYERVQRSETVDVRFQNTDGSIESRVFTGVNAVAFQHELDHLDGVTFLSHMGKVQKHLATKRLTKIKRKSDRQYKQLTKLIRRAA